MIISIDAEKTFNKAQQSFVTEASKNQEHRKYTLMWAIHGKPVPDITLSDERLKAYSLKCGMREVPTVTALFQWST